MSFNNSSTCINASCTTPRPTQKYTVYQESQELKIFRLVMFGIVLLAAFVGNFMVIKAILGKRRTPFVYWLVSNLAVGEIISTTCMLFVFTYMELGNWVFGGFLCNVIFPLQSTALAVVTTTIAVISIRRYQVVSGVGMNFPSSKRGVRLVIGGIWLYAFAVCLPLFIYHEVTPSNSPDVWYCQQKYPDTSQRTGWHQLNTSQVYSIVRFFLCFVIQVFIMMLSYGAVTVNIKKQVRIIIKNTRSRVDSTLSNTRVTECGNLDVHRGSSSPPTVHQLVPLQDIITRAQEAERETREKPEVRALLDQEGDLTRMFYIIVLIFIVFYLPYQIFHVFELFWHELQGWEYTYIIRKYFLLMTCLPSALHPLCYGTMSRFYAMAFKKIVLCKCHR